MTEVTQLKEAVVKTAEEVKSNYNAEEVPMGSYAALMGIYTLAFGALYALTKAKSKQFKKPSFTEFAFLTIGSYKLSRVITMSFIATPIRAPFTTRGKSLKGGEVQDEARGEGLQKAIGNLVTCPFCFNVWASTGFAFLHVFVPSVALRIAQILTSAAASDVLDLSYRRLREGTR